MTKLRQLIMSSLLLLGLAVAPALVAVNGVSAQLQFDNCDGIQGCLDSGAAETDPAGPDGSAAADQVSSTVQLIVNVFSWIVGVIAVIMIIIGGLKYITSGGDSGNITSAKNTILYAIIGLVIVALAQIIVRFVIGQVVA
jgi:hypothetical protein